MNKQKKLSTILTIGLAAGALSGCTAYQMKYKNPGAQPGEKHTVKQSFFLWGLFGGDEVDIARLCPQGVAEISSSESFGDQLFFAFTGGLYSPRSVELHCQSGTAYRIDKGEDDAVSVKEITADDD
jgi:hypothetical protein